jgi:hypothetical protein
LHHPEYANQDINGFGLPLYQFCKEVKD